MIVVGGALAVASVGYGVGTQVGDGTAVAGSEQGSDSESRRGAPPGFGEMGQPPGFRDLARKLGVSTSELANAFRAFHESEEGDRRDEFAAALAKALGISTDKVTAAFEQLHTPARGALRRPAGRRAERGRGQGEGGPRQAEGRHARGIPRISRRRWPTSSAWA